MNYGYKRQINLSFEEVDNNIRETLKEEGFGVITEIDVQNTFKKKLNTDFKKYKILGACEPHTAFQALSIDEQIGLLLPCNIVLWENEDKTTTVVAIDPKTQLSIADNEELSKHAHSIDQKLRNAVDKL